MTVILGGRTETTDGAQPVPIVSGIRSSCTGGSDNNIIIVPKRSPGYSFSFGENVPVDSDSGASAYQYTVQPGQYNLSTAKLNGFRAIWLAYALMFLTTL